MQFDVDIRLYEYRHEQVKIRKKRWNNKEIKKFIENKFVNRKLEKGGRGPCHERLCTNSGSKCFLLLAN